MSLLPLLVLHWIAGDLHMHVSPPDDPHDVAMSAQEIAKAAHDQGLEFVILTPHMRVHRPKRFAAAWEKLAAEARAITGVTLIPGAELGVPGLGHFGISGVDVGALGDDPLAEARRLGAFIVVNHPFAVPTDIPGVRASRLDLSYQPWSHGARGWSAFDGVEVWNVPLALANLISRPAPCHRSPGGRMKCGGQGESGEARAFVEADRVARTEKRRVTITGGTDNHRRAVIATTWVLADDASETSILAALRHGATCVGGVDGGDLSARGDRDGAHDWARIGDSVRAASSVELRWAGTAELYVDGVDQGALDGGTTVAVDAAVHTFRIEEGASRCGFVYANLP